MKKFVVLLVCLLTVLSSVGSYERNRITTAMDDEVIMKRVILAEDQNIRVDLYYSERADVTLVDWLRIEIENKSTSPLIIKGGRYKIGRDVSRKDGEKYIADDQLGSSSVFSLLYSGLRGGISMQDLGEDFTISPLSVISGWRELSSYASVSLDGDRSDAGQVSGYVQIEISYVHQGRLSDLNSQQKNFYFNWTKKNAISKTALAERLQYEVLNPAFGSGTWGILRNLMWDNEIAEKVGTEELIQGVIRRKRLVNPQEVNPLLIELQNREAIPDIRLTEHYREKILLGNPDGYLLNELRNYWDNSLMRDLFQSRVKSSLPLILELHSNYWSGNNDYVEDVYSHLRETINFDFDEEVTEENFKHWARCIETMSISRSPRIIDYLKGFLSDERHFYVEDWSKYTHYGYVPKTAKPDLKEVRICDVAFISILRAFNQFEFQALQIESGAFYTRSEVKTEILDKATADSIRGLVSPYIGLGKLDSELKLTSEFYEKIMNY